MSMLRIASSTAPSIEDLIAEIERTRARIALLPDEASEANDEADVALCAALQGTKIETVSSLWWCIKELSLVLANEDVSDHARWLINAISAARLILAA